MNNYETTHQNTADLHYEGEDFNGLPIIVDASELSPGYFEIMALRPGGAELDSKCAATQEAAAKAYHAMVKRFTTKKKVNAPKPLTGQYAKLRDDLRTVHQIGLDAAAKADDGGTSNHDAPALHLPTWKRALVEQACKEAGGGCFFWRCFGANMCVVCLPTPGQAHKRETAAEAMTKALSNLGYDALCYQQMD